MSTLEPAMTMGVAFAAPFPRPSTALSPAEVVARIEQRRRAHFCQRICKRIAEVERATMAHASTEPDTGFHRHSCLRCIDRGRRDASLIQERLQIPYRFGTVTAAPPGQHGAVST
jgi:hypothetical protein